MDDRYGSCILPKQKKSPEKTPPVGGFNPFNDCFPKDRDEHKRYLSCHDEFGSVPIAAPQFRQGFPSHPVVSNIKTCGYFGESLQIAPL